MRAAALRTWVLVGSAADLDKVYPPVLGDPLDVVERVLFLQQRASAADEHKA
jgi:hypothetical protein